MKITNPKFFVRYSLEVPFLQCDPKILIFPNGVIYFGAPTPKAPGSNSALSTKQKRGLCPIPNVSARETLHESLSSKSLAAAGNVSVSGTLAPAAPSKKRNIR